MSAEVHERPEFALPSHLISRPLNTFMIWEPRKANGHFSPVHRIGALSDDLAMLGKPIAQKNSNFRLTLEQSAKSHAHKIITANMFYQRRIGKELEILFALRPEDAERTSNYLRESLESYAQEDYGNKHYQRVADRLGIAYNG
jgi:hypothetical protein